MSVKIEEILKQIEFVLSQYDEYHENNQSFNDIENNATIYTLLTSTIGRFAPATSYYYENMVSLRESISDLCEYGELQDVNSSLAGVLHALQLAYQQDLLLSVHELIHADLFEDFLEMSEYLLNEKYKDAAAIMIGGVLEEHLRKLCLKSGINIAKSDGTPIKADKMNADLSNKGVYNKGDQKSITAWLDLRNNAAHAKYDTYTDKQVEFMLMSVRDFINRYRA